MIPEVVHCLPHTPSQACMRTYALMHLHTHEHTPLFTQCWLMPQEVKLQKATEKYKAMTLIVSYDCLH